MKDKEKCQNAMYTISQYMFTRNEYTPSLNEAVDAIEFIDELVDEYYELVEHTTPKKVVWIYDDEPLCPACSEAIDAGDQELCEFCQQRLDWSEDGE